jgi:peptidoglycan hydrolase-like protein with peptidoglycan-binding domain
MDTMVAASQMWLNNHYTGVAGWNPVPESGVTGWTTVNAIIRGLQHELGITALSDTFGPTTLSYLTSQVGSVGPSTSNSDVIGLMQCGMWCKGYPGGEQFGDWTLSPALNSSLPSMRAAMGLGTTNALPPKAFKSLLTMDAYSIRAGGSMAIGEVQRWLNGTYYGRADYFLVPCDGLFSRDVQRGLMLAIQYELGMADGIANGNFGAGTQSGLQTYGVFGSGAMDSTRKLVRLFKAALIFNGYEVPFSGTFDATTVAQTNAFQSFATLSTTGSANFQTWAALLVSTGDPNRAVSAVDTSTPLTPATALTLSSGGYGTVGRYLNGASKRIQPDELTTIFSAGLKVFPIYQENNNDVLWFNSARGEAQGEAAARRARQLGLAAGTTIYFAVDCDPTDDDIVARIIPYFQGVKKGIESSKFPSYLVGVYGTRNVGSRLSAAGLASKSFIAGMSTGWSGNLGFRLPANWAYDQIQTKTLGSASGAISVDRNAKATNAPAVIPAEVKATPRVTSGGVSQYDEAGWWRWSALSVAAERSRHEEYPFQPLQAQDFAQIVLHRLRQPDFWLMPGEDPFASGNRVKAAWTVYTPDPPFRIGHAIQDAYLAASEQFAVYYKSIDSYSNTVIYDTPAEGRIGDTVHFAASVLSLLAWGVPSPSNLGATEGEFGAWGLDLGTVWDEYELERITQGGTLDVEDWMESRIGVGTSAETKFGRADLQADMAAFLVAKALDSDADRPLDDVLRELYANIGANPGYLATEFVAQRFGSLQAMATTVPSIFTQSWLENIPIDLLIGQRYPGAEAPVLNPPQAVRDQELEKIGLGFAAAVANAMSWTTLD